MAIRFDSPYSRIAIFTCRCMGLASSQWEVGALMSEIKIQFSTCAPPTWKERWRDKTFKDYSACICRITHSEYSHGDYILSDGNLLGASDNPYAPIIETNPPGNPRGVAVRIFDYQRFTIRRTATIHCSDEVKQKFHNFLWRQLGKPFDSTALKPSTFLSHNFETRDWRNPTRWYCFELLCHAAESSGLIPWRIIGMKNRVTGNDFLYIISPLIDAEEFEMSAPIPAGPWEH